MTNTKLYLLILFVVCLFSACKDEKCKDVNNNITDIKEETIKVTKYDINPEWGIEEVVGINGDQLVCQSNNADKFYYVLSTKDFTLQESFGVKGNAANEWIMPHLLLTGEKGKCYVIDNGTRKIHTLVNYKITTQNDSPVNGLINGEKMYKHLLCYEDMSPNEIILRTIDINTGAKIDSLVFADPAKQGMSYKEDFAYCIKDGKLVLGQIHKNNIKILDISDDGKLKPRCNIQGSTEDKAVYYTGVAIGKGTIYMLSQRHRKEGYSSIEEYDFDGKAVRNIKLDFKASKIMFDENNNMLILSGSKDGALRTIKL